jgi:tRNA(His) guanylyltransferase
MACSRFEYVKSYELLDPPLLPSTYLIIRLDGQNFSSTTASWTKPVDSRGIHLMTSAALAVIKTYPDIRISYGHSDEYSFILDKNTKLFNRRGFKVVSLVVSLFTAVFNRRYGEYFEGDVPIGVFDGRVVMYPSLVQVRDYLSWRQADCHINNLVTIKTNV